MLPELLLNFPGAEAVNREIEIMYRSSAGKIECYGGDGDWTEELALTFPKNAG